MKKGLKENGGIKDYQGLIDVINKGTLEQVDKSRKR